MIAITAAGITGHAGNIWPFVILLWSIPAWITFGILSGIYQFIIGKAEQDAGDQLPTRRETKRDAS